MQKYKGELIDLESTELVRVPCKCGDALCARFRYDKEDLSKLYVHSECKKFQGKLVGTLEEVQELLEI